MGSRKKILCLIFILTAIFLFAFTSILLYQKVQSPNSEFIASTEVYVASFRDSLIYFIMPAFILGIFCWLILKKKKRKIISYFIFFNVIGLILMLAINLREYYKIWHYNKYEVNVKYNESLSHRHGTYIDTCLFIVVTDIEKRMISKNDFRISSFIYSQKLNTIPRDTSNRYYLFKVFYTEYKNGAKDLRAAKYFFHFNGDFIKLYDVDVDSQMAKLLIDSLETNYEKRNNILYKISDSSDIQITEIDS